MIEDFKPLSEAYEDIKFPGQRASKKMVREMLMAWAEAIKGHSKEKIDEQEQTRWKVMFDMMTQMRLTRYSGTE